jgi:hypothetical protein
MRFSSFFFCCCSAAIWSSLFLPELARSGDPAIWYHCRYPNLIRAAPSLRPDMIFGKDRLGNRLIPATGVMSLMKIEF